jgi:catechol 2,3-dioxygenase-like lactoylglutathione lyase family enzyme
MAEIPGYGIAVDDIERSVEFYRDGLGLSVDTDTGIGDTAILMTTRGQLIMLAGPTAPDWPELLSDQYTILRREDAIYMDDGDFDQRLARLSNGGSVSYQLIQKPWGDCSLEVTDPDGYRIAFWKLQSRSRQEILDMFDAARTGLRSAIEELSEDELAWRPGIGEWSVREVIHHVADANLTVLHVARVALADPGREYFSNPYDQNHYATELRYQERDVHLALALFEASWDFLLSMADAIPDGWERSARTARGGETSVESFLLMLATHSLEHLEQINDVRRAMGR